MDLGIFGVSTCISDYLGEFASARTTWCFGNPSPREAEAIGLLSTKKWIEESGSTNIIFYTYCKRIGDVLNAKKQMFSEFGFILSHNVVSKVIKFKNLHRLVRVL